MNSQRKRLWKLSISCVFLLSVMQANLFGLTLTVQEPGGTPVNGYRWLVEEDNTNWATAGAGVADSLAVDIHNSYAPVVAKGHRALMDSEPPGQATINVPSTKRYIVSVLPDAGHAMGGKIVGIGQTEVTVVVNPFPIPTAQITLLAFHDNYPINNAPDAGEAGLAGFSVVIAEAAGHQMMDAWGNMLGTTYQQNPDGSFYEALSITGPYPWQAACL